MSDVKRYWIRGMMWFTREDCERECRSIHARLGVKECPEEVVKASDYATLREECRWAMERVCWWIEQNVMAHTYEKISRERSQRMLHEDRHYQRAQAWLAANPEEKEAHKG